jgi:hypothetical protein
VGRKKEETKKEEAMLDILYYSNYCDHSKHVLQHLVKNGMTEKMNFICIDNRKRDDDSNNTFIILENGKKVILPPNVHSVPALLLTRENYRVVFGEENIFSHFESFFQSNKVNATNQLGYYNIGNSASVSLQAGNGEPLGISLKLSNSGMNIVSEQFTPYDMSSEELSSKGMSERRNMYDYYPASHDINYKKIMTPVDDYSSDKIPSNVTIDSLEQKRFKEVRKDAEPVMLI